MHIPQCWWYKTTWAARKRTCKARAVDVSDPVVWDEEALFPTHEDTVTIAVADGEPWPADLLSDLLKCREARPVSHIFLLACTPVVSEEAVSRTDYLGIEVGGELWPVVCEATDAKVSTKEGRRKIDVLK